MLSQFYTRLTINFAEFNKILSRILWNNSDSKSRWILLYGIELKRSRRDWVSSCYPTSSTEDPLRKDSRCALWKNLIKRPASEYVMSLKHPKCAVRFNQMLVKWVKCFYFYVLYHRILMLFLKTFQIKIELNLVLFLWIIVTSWKLF